MGWTHPDHKASAEEAIARGVIKGDIDVLGEVPEPQQSSEHQARVSSLSILNQLGGPDAVVETPWSPRPPSPPPPTGNVVVIPAGVHERYHVEVRPDTHYIGEDGAVLDGREATVSAFTGAADNVTIENLEIRNYNNPVQVGAIHLMGGDNVHVVGCNINDNLGVGVKLRYVTNSSIRNNNIHHNRQLGISFEGVDLLCADNEIAFNNWLEEVSWGFEAGGTKFWKTTNLTVRGNYSHDNHGPGLWDDKDNVNILYEDNVVEDNYANGIFHEIGGAGVIRNNVVRRNGPGQGNWLWGAGILIATSYDTEVYGNLLEDNFNGLSLTKQARGSGAYGEHRADGCVFRDNVVRGVGASGVVRDDGDDSLFDNVEWFGNSYDDNHRFAWLNRWGDIDWWRGYHPEDAV